MILRNIAHNAIVTALERSRVVALLGPRQCGKTTLARQFVPADSASYFDLEDPSSLARLDEPMTALRDLSGLVVIDEVQRRPSCSPSCVSLRTELRCLPVFSSWGALRPISCASHRSPWPVGWKPSR